MNTPVMARLGSVDVYSDSRALGQLARFQDQDQTDPNAIIPVTGVPIWAVYVMNDSGGTLGSGLGVKWKSGYIGTRVGGLSGANEVADGVVDPFIRTSSSSTVANGSYFWMIIQGPIDVEIGSGNIAANDPVQTIASGKFATGAYGTNPAGNSGRAVEAANSGSRARIFFNNPNSAVKPG